MTAKKMFPQLVTPDPVPGSPLAFPTGTFYPTFSIQPPISYFKLTILQNEYYKKE